MPRKYQYGGRWRLDLSFILLTVLLGILWLAGGASRADVMGQVIVRGGAWLCMIAGLLFCGPPSFREVRPVALVLLAALLLVMLQLLPLPPALWQSLPGRAVLGEAAAASGQAQPWRPWSIVPGATANAAASLIVPLAVLALIASAGSQARSWLPGVLLSLMAASMMLGLLQLSSGGMNYPFVNDTPGQVGGTFANRNHFALFLAMGCVLAPVWAFQERQGRRWRGGVAFGLVLLFALTILASGSRAGMLVGGLAIGLGLLLVRQPLREELRGAPRWAFPALIVMIAGVIAAFIFISVLADRAVSISRVVALNSEDDMRSRALPTMMVMIQTYFPVGTGFGSFAPMFRMHEPFELLQLTYFNHGHNDFLEIVVDAGLPGLLLILAALGWWGRTSFRVWRAGTERHHMLAKLGSAMLFLLIVASIFDYPARTPLIMAMMVLAGVWLSGSGAPPKQGRGLALPGVDQHL